MTSDVVPPSAPAPPLYVVLDTSVYVHCRRFDEVAWPKEFATDRVALVVPMQVLRELDTIKDQHRSKVIRERVGKIIARLRVLLKADAASPVREGVTVEFHHARLTRAEFDAMGLDSEIADERILAETIALRDARPGSRVVFVSRDNAPQILAAQLGLEVIPIPDELELPPEPDPAERELRQLREEHARLQNTRPRLALSFANGAAKFDVVLRPASEPEDDLEYSVDELAAEFPEFDPILAGFTMPGPHAQALSFPHQSEIDRYNRERKTYRHNARIYLLSRQRWLERRARTATVQLALVNLGGAPAIDVSAELRFPDDVVIEIDDTALLPPDPPPEPRAPGQASAYQPDDPGEGYTAPFLRPVTSSRTYPLDGLYVGDDDIDRTPRALWYLPKLQQSRDATESVSIVFASPAEVRAFTIEYDLRADTMPPIKGTLHVVARWVVPPDPAGRK